MPQARLAELLEIEPISVSRLLDRMEEAGWIERRPDADDRRVRRVYPTARAQAVYGRVRGMAHEVYGEALAGVPDADRAALIRTLETITTNLSDGETGVRRGSAQRQTRRRRWNERDCQTEDRQGSEAGRADRAERDRGSGSGGAHAARSRRRRSAVAGRYALMLALPRRAGGRRRLCLADRRALSRAPRTPICSRPGCRSPPRPRAASSRSTSPTTSRSRPGDVLFRDRSRALPHRAARRPTRRWRRRGSMSSSCAPPTAQAVAQRARRRRARSHYLEREFERQTGAVRRAGVNTASALDEAHRDLRTRPTTSSPPARPGRRERAGRARRRRRTSQPTRTRRCMAALAARDKAAYDLAQTTVRAPADGVDHPGVVVQGRPVRRGRARRCSRWSRPATPGSRRTSRKPQLTHMKAGPDRPRWCFDTYPDQPLHGDASTAIGAGTGAEFSLLPAQNATGNWVKVTQRVPVRLQLDAEARRCSPLRTGMSASVEVDTGARPQPRRASFGRPPRRRRTEAAAPA